MKPQLLNLPTRIQTPRLLLRVPQPGDGAAINAAIVETEDNLKPWMPWVKTLPSVEDSEVFVRMSQSKFLSREDLAFQIRDLKTDQYLGGTGLHRIKWEVPSVEIGYWIRKSAEGNGLVTESTLAMTYYAFEWLKAKRVEIRCDANNEKSEKVMKRLGFEFEARLRNQAVSPIGELRDTLIYSKISPKGLPPLELKFIL